MTQDEKDEVAALVPLLKAVAECAQKWGWHEERAVKLMRVCWRWTATGTITDPYHAQHEARDRISITGVLRYGGPIGGAYVIAGERFIDVEDLIQASTGDPPADGSLAKIDMSFQAGSIAPSPPPDPLPVGDPTSRRSPA